jgi:hypothetical protein
VCQLLAAAEREIGHKHVKEIIFAKLNFCVGNLRLLTFHHSHDFATIIWNRRSIDKKLHYYSDNVLTDSVTATVWCFVLTECGGFVVCKN